MKKNRLINHKGQVIILVAVALILLILFVGLAIDSGIGYTVRAKLNSAVDAATIAAGRALGQGGTDDIRIANGTDAANKFFHANFPSGYLRATPSEPTVNIVHNTDGTWHVTVTATATVPTFFMRIVGRNALTTTALAETLRRDLDMILVLDCSGSLGPPTSSYDTFPKLKAAAISFINNFVEGPGGDRVGLVTFASGAVTDVYINKDSTRGFDKTQVINAINALTVGGATASEEAMRRALTELDAVPPDVRSSLRVIVFFSDGAPNIVAGNFNNGPPGPGDLYSETEDTGNPPRRMYKHDARDYFLGNYNSINTLPITDYTENVLLESYNGKRILNPPPGHNGSNTRCNLNKAARNMLENVANTARSENPQPIHVYTLGLGARLNSLEIHCPGYGTDEYGANILRRLANTTDSDTYNGDQPISLYVYAENADELENAFNAIASHILRLIR
jgi:Flp pilus assembly protein TadG